MDPKQRIEAYLNKNQLQIQLTGTVDSVIADVKLFVFFNSPPLTDDEIRKIVMAWSIVGAPLLPTKTSVRGNPAAPGTSSNSGSANPLSDFKAAATKAITTIGAGVTVGPKDNNINIGITGATANLKRNDNAASLGISWGGTLKMDANYGPFHMSASLAKDSWEIVLSFPDDTYVPDLSSLGKVISEGEGAVRKMAEATRGFKSISDAGAVGAVVKAESDKVTKAMEAVTGIAKHKGGASFGFKAGSPDAQPGQQGIPPGYQVGVFFTYTF
jgi:hypothetical protein